MLSSPSRVRDGREVGRALPRRLRVVHVVSQLDMGGMEKLLVEFARHTDREQFELRFVSLGGRGSLADDIEAEGWAVTHMGVKAGLRPRLVLDLARLFRAWKCHVVHSHNSGPLIYSSPAARFARVGAVVHTRHGQRFEHGRRQTAAFRLAACLADRVVCVSHDGAGLSVGEGIASRKVCTIWNGIDVSRFSYTGPRAGGPIVMVGRLSPEKDVTTLLRAVARAAADHPGLVLDIVGQGECQPALKALASDLGLDGRVRFLGEVRDIPRVLAGASLFVLPSLTEGISLTLLEAMARGLPVIATRVGGNPEVVVDGETGLLVPAKAVDEMARAMLRLLGDPGEGRRMGQAGRHRVEVHFDVRRMVSDYEALYVELCRDRLHLRPA